MLKVLQGTIDTNKVFGWETHVWIDGRYDHWKYGFVQCSSQEAIFCESIIHGL